MFNKHNFAIAKLADKGRNRYATGGLYVCQTETVVTDGHQLTRVSAVSDGEEYRAVGLASDIELATDFKPFVMPADAALKVAKEKPMKYGEKRIAIASESNANGHSAVVVADNVQRAPKIEAQFPDYVRCVPNPETLEVVIAFNPKLLADVLAMHVALQDGIAGTPTVILRMKDNKSAFTIESSHDGQTMHSTVMPVKMP